MIKRSRVALLVFFICLSSILPAQAKSKRKYNYKKYYNKEEVAELNKKAKGRASDVIAVAKSQLGYKGKVKHGKRYSYYGSVWKPAKKINKREDSAGNWCSEFAWWCLVKARVIKRKANLVDLDRFKFYYRNRIYKLKNSAYNSYIYHTIPQCEIVANWFIGYQERRVLSVYNLTKGDILQICNDCKSNAKAPHHTAIFYKRTNGKLKVIEGNVNNDGHYTRVAWGTYDPHEVIAVIRPKYKKSKKKK